MPAFAGLGAPHWDPYARGILAGSGQLQSERLEQYAVVGELALEGTTRPVRGAVVDGHSGGPAGGSAFGL